MPHAHMLLAATRPFRACTQCFLPGTLLVCSIFLFFVMWGGLLSPMFDLHRTWTPTSCTFTEPMTLKRIHHRKSADGYRIGTLPAIERRNFAPLRPPNLSVCVCLR